STRLCRLRPTRPRSGRRTWPRPRRTRPGSDGCVRQMWSRRSPGHHGSVVVRADGEQPPLAGNPLQLVHAASLEGEAGSGDEVLDRLRDEHLAGLRVRGDAGAGMDGDAGHLAVHELALARVEARSDLDPELADRVRYRARAADRPRGPVKGGEKAVAGRLDLPAAKANERAAHELVVALEEPQPGMVAQGSRFLA